MIERMERHISPERLAEMKELAEKKWLTQTYRGRDISGTVEIPLPEFGAISRALVEAVHELERLYSESETRSST
jgi:hypothetical protein